MYTSKKSRLWLCGRGDKTVRYESQRASTVVCNNTNPLPFCWDCQCIRWSFLFTQWLWDISQLICASFGLPLCTESFVVWVQHFARWFCVCVCAGKRANRGSARMGAWDMVPILSWISVLILLRCIQKNNQKKHHSVRAGSKVNIKVINKLSCEMQTINSNTIVVFRMIHTDSFVFAVIKQTPNSVFWG